MKSPMKLPPVDQFREPFVVPLGHLTMQAAYADEQLASLCAATCAECNDRLSAEAAAHRLRNWDDAAKQFARDCLRAIKPPEFRDRALAALDDYETLRTLRHRAIHDALSVGLFGDADTGYEARALAVEYRRSGRETKLQLRVTTPDDMAHVACRLHEVQKTFEFIAYQLSDSLRSGAT